jgi:ATP-dependent DNA helicase DinG
MAMAVANTVAEGGSLVVEAGTGVGKTFAYLVPALLSGERVLLSTATKNLQDQLFASAIGHAQRPRQLCVPAALGHGAASRYFARPNFSPNLGAGANLGQHHPYRRFG